MVDKAAVADKLYAISESSHSQHISERAQQVLKLRSESDIDTLMKISSTSIQQRWDFLGPTAAQVHDLGDKGAKSAIDNALQWQDDAIGEYIRLNFVASTVSLSSSNVVYRRVDAATMHAAIPFALVADDVCDTSTSSYLVVFVWESDDWLYFNTIAYSSRSPELLQFSSTIVLAEKAYSAACEAREMDQDQDQGSDDEYWSRFPKPARLKHPAHSAEPAGSHANACSEDDYWAQYDAGGGGESDAQDDEPSRDPSVLEPSPGLLPQRDVLIDATMDSLRGTAKIAKSVGLSEVEFLVLAQQAFNIT